MWNFLFDTTSWPPRWQCGSWATWLGYTNIVSEFLIWGAYMTIPLIITYFLYKRKDIPFNRVFLLFAFFIFACGFTHFIEGFIFYVPLYGLLTLLLVITAIVSWSTAFALIPTLPKVLALPSLEKVNELLKQDLNVMNTRLEIAVETLKAGIIDWNLQSDEMELTDALIETLTLSTKNKKINSSDFFNYVYFEDKEHLMEFIHDHARNENLQSRRFRMQVDGKTAFNVVFSWKIIFNDQNEPSHLIGTIVKPA